MIEPGQTVKKFHEGYTYKFTIPALPGWNGNPDTPERESERHVEYAIEWTDGSITTFDSCGCCGGVEVG